MHAGIVLTSIALAQSPWDLSAGAGLRWIDTQGIVDEYAQAYGEELVGQIFDEGTIPVPYLTLDANRVMRRDFMQPGDELTLGLAVQTTGSWFFKEYDGVESNIDYEQEGMEVIVDTTWHERLDHYTKLELGSMYSPEVYQRGQWRFQPAFGGAAGVSRVRNTACVDVTLEENDAVAFLGGAQTVEQALGIYTRSSTLVDSRGTGLSVGWNAQFDAQYKWLLISLEGGRTREVVFAKSQMTHWMGYDRDRVVDDPIRHRADFSGGYVVLSVGITPQPLLSNQGCLLLSGSYQCHK